MAKVTSSSNRSKRTASKRPTSSATRATRSKASSNSSKMTQSGGGTTGSAKVTTSGGKTVQRTTTKQLTLNLRGKVGGMKDGSRPVGGYGESGGKIGPAYSSKTAEANRAKGPKTRQGSLDLKGTRFKAKPRVPGGNFRAPSIPKPVAAASKGTSSASKLGKIGALGAVAAAGLTSTNTADGTLKGKPLPRPKGTPSKAEKATASDFGKSFKKARAMGAKEFMWKGKRYTTKRADGK